MNFSTANRLLLGARVAICLDNVFGSLQQRMSETPRFSHAKSYRRYRPTAYRLDMRVTGQDNLWPSNMPPCRSCASLGGSPISILGAAVTGQVTPSESYGFNAPIKMHQSRPCCSSY